MKTLASVLLVLFALLACAAPISAALVSRDWLTPGDGLLTFDTVSGREWLDVSQTELTLFSASDITDVAIADAKLQLLPGGALEGFTLAARSDVSQLVAAAGVDVSTVPLANASADNMRRLIALLSSNSDFYQLGDGHRVLGVIDEQIPPATPFENLNVAASLAVSAAAGSNNGRAQFGFGNGGRDAYPVRGIEGVHLMLVRSNVVPEPCTLISLSTLVGLFTFAHRIRSHRFLKV